MEDFLKSCNGYCALVFVIVSGIGISASHCPTPPNQYRRMAVIIWPPFFCCPSHVSSVGGNFANSRALVETAILECP
jgi:hypothetical protein